MLIAVAILAAFAALLAAARLGALYRSIRLTRQELCEINAGEDSNRQLHSPLPDRELEGLLCEINRALELRQTDRIASARREQELRRQIANVSHDLRTPLTSILGYTALMADAAPGEAAEYLAVIEKRARVLQTLVTSFYDLSRLEAGEYALQIEPVNLYNTLCEIMAAFYRDFTERGFHVIADLEEAPLVVAADRAAVTRVFTNLIQNALRHGETAVTIVQRREGASIVTRVSNDAPAMTGEDLAHVFDRFFTADKMRTGQDTGLGLTIVRQFVERMGHAVSASLEDGVFTVEIRWQDRPLQRQGKRC